jgi:hypothetical protein
MSLTLSELPVPAISNDRRRSSGSGRVAGVLCRNPKFPPIFGTLGPQIVGEMNKP